MDTLECMGGWHWSLKTTAEFTLSTEYGVLVESMCNKVEGSFLDLRFSQW